MTPASSWWPDPSLLPYPIARTYFESLRTDDSAANQLQNTIGAYSALLRFVALTLVSQFLAGDNDPNDQQTIRVAKMIATLRFPTLATWPTAIHTIRTFSRNTKLDAKAFHDGGPFLPSLFVAADEFKAARVGSQPLHEAITSLRNDYIGHHEGMSAEHAAKRLDQIRPLVLRAMQIFSAALTGITLLRSNNDGSMTVLRGPGPEFEKKPLADPLLADLFESTSLLLVGDGCALSLYPLVLAGEPNSGSPPALSFDGYRVRVEENVVGFKRNVACLKYVFFGDFEYRSAEYIRYRELMDRFNISPYFDKDTFQPWTVAAWAANETRVNLAYLNGTKYFPDYYTERPGVEDRVRRWLDEGVTPALLVAADAGYGKTSLFCHTAEQLLSSGGDETEYQDCVVLVLGSDLRSSLFERLSQATGIAAQSGQNKQGFQGFGDVLDLWRARASKKDLHSEARRLVVLLDAANEARNVSGLVSELSDLAKEAHAANLAAGRQWVRLLVSIRSTHFEVLDRKEGLAHETGVLPADGLFEQFKLPDGTGRPYLGLPEFTSAEAARVYAMRATGQPASTLVWGDLSPNLHELLRQPMLIDIFHRAFARGEKPYEVLVADETSLWERWFETQLPENGAGKAVVREFALRIGAKCLTLGQTAIGPELEAEIEAEWEQKTGRDARNLLALADLNLFERLAALGVLRQRAEGGWEWRAQVLGEHVCFRSLPAAGRVQCGIEGDWAEWQKLPDTPLLRGALSLMVAEWWRQGDIGRFAARIHSQAAESSVVHGIIRAAPLGAPNEIVTEMAAFSEAVGSFEKLAERRYEMAKAADALEQQVGGKPAARVIWEAELARTRKRVQAEPDDPILLRDLSAFYERLADLDAEVDTTRARQGYTKCLEIRKKLVQLKPDETIYLRHLSASHSRLAFLESAANIERARQGYNEAMETRKRLVQLEPSNTMFLRDLANTYSCLADLDSAADCTRARLGYTQSLEIYRKLVQLEPQNKSFLRDLANSYSRLANLDSTVDTVLARQGYAQSLDIRKNLVQLEPDNTTFLNNLSNSYLSLARLDAAVDPERARHGYTEALEIFQKLVRVEPDNTTFLSNLSNSYLSLARLDAAVDPERARHGYTKALEIFQKLVRVEPDNTTFLSNLSNFYLLLARLDAAVDPEHARHGYTEALEIFQKLVELAPSNMSFLRSLAKSYSHLANLDSISETARARQGHTNALEIRQKLVQLEPNNTKFLRDLSVSYMNLAKLESTVDTARTRQGYTQALEINKKLVQLEPDNTNFLSNLSNSYLSLARLDAAVDPERARHGSAESLDIRKKLVQLQPDNTDFLDSLAVSYLQLANFEKDVDPVQARQASAQSLDIRKKLVQLQPDNTEFLDNLALSYLQLANFEKDVEPVQAHQASAQSLDILEKLVQLQPDNTEFLDNLAVSYLQLANFEKDVDPIRARKASARSLDIREKLAQLQPDNTEFLDDLAVSYLQLANFEEDVDPIRARQCFKQYLAIRNKLVQLEPNNEEFLRSQRLADYLEGLRTWAALPWWKRWRTKKPRRNETIN
jgi:Flp pilus assembly protein TadD